MKHNKIIRQFPLLLLLLTLIISCNGNKKGGQTSPVSQTARLQYLFSSSSVKGGWRGCDGLQPESCDSIEGLYKAVEESREDFTALLEDIKEEFTDINPMILRRLTLKNPERIKEKLREDQRLNDLAGNGELVYDKATDTYHCRSIRDCDGATICVTSLDEIQTILQYLDKQPYVVRIKNNFATPTATGYSDINMNIKLPKGTIVELQLNTLANLVAKERYDHVLYEIYRSVASNPSYRELADIISEAQKAIFTLSADYSRRGAFPENDGEDDIYAPDYKFQPYADTIRPFVEKAKPLVEKAIADGIILEATVKHFNQLLEYIK